MSQVNFAPQSAYAETHRSNQAYLQSDNTLKDDNCNTSTKKGDTVSISEDAYYALFADNSQSSSEDSNNMTTSNLDVVSISDESSKALYKNINNIDELNFSTIKTIDTDDGTKIEISYAIDKDNNTVAMANFSYSDGTIQNIILNETSVISKNDNIWTLNNQDISNHEQVEYAKLNIQDDAGKRTEYIYKDEVSVNGYDSDDIIIILPSKSEDRTIFNVNTGEGNNLVIDLSGEISNIKAGSGNDTIVGVSSANARGAMYTVDSGSGNDMIELAGSSANISSGDGNDTISVNTISSYTIDAGNGNDIIDANVKIAHAIIGGEGNDKINVLGNMSSVDIYGGTIENPDIDNDSINISGNLINSNIYTGGGGNTITIGSAFNTTINTGSGNDTVKIGTIFNSTIDTGDGDDNISINFASGGKIISGPGSNIIDILNAFGSEIYNTEIEKKQKDAYKKSSNNAEQAELSEYDKQIAEAAIGGDNAESDTEEILPEEVEPAQHVIINPEQQ